LARRGIRQLLDPYDDIDVVGETRNGPETVRALRELKPDLVFLDIRMPLLDGFGVLRAIGVKQMPSVIFVTAHDEFAVRAFDAHAVDYLIKPLRKTRFAEALERIRERRRSANAFQIYRQLSAVLAAGERERIKRKIVVPTSKGELIIDENEIDWIEAQDYYARIFAGQRRHLVRESLTSLAQRLDAKHFVRVHRSAIVNIDRVKEVRQESGDTSLLLFNGTRVPVSRRRRRLTRLVLRRLSEPVDN